MRRDAFVQSCDRVIHGSQQRHRNTKGPTTQMGEIFGFSHLLPQPIGDMLQQSVAHVPPG